VDLSSYPTKVPAISDVRKQWPGVTADV
jgi:hypothetical protein